MSRRLTIALSCLVIAFPVLVAGAADEFGFKPQRSLLRHVEEFYLLYTQNLGTPTDEIGRNVMYLEYALGADWIHPVKALCPIRTTSEWERYKLLLRTRILFLLAQGYVQYGYRWDKEDVLFYNMEYADELKKGFEVAGHMYGKAMQYWALTKEAAAAAMRDEKTKLHGALIDDVYNEAKSIHYGLIDYGKTIRFRLRDIDRKQQKLASGKVD